VKPEVCLRASGEPSPPYKASSRASEGIKRWRSSAQDPAACCPSRDLVRRAVERLHVERRHRTVGVVRWFSLLAAGCLAAVVVTGCTAGHNEAGNPVSTRTSASAPPTGTLTGTLAVYGGTETTRSCGCHLEQGTVELHRGSGPPVVLKVGKSGRFSARVSAGQYSVVAGTHGATHWPMGSCWLLLIASEPGARPSQHSAVTIRRSQTTHVAVGCVGE
jgi:hypothetical protein